MLNVTTLAVLLHFSHVARLRHVWVNSNMYSESNHGYRNNIIVIVIDREKMK